MLYNIIIFRNLFKKCCDYLTKSLNTTPLSLTFFTTYNARKKIIQCTIYSSDDCNKCPCRTLVAFFIQVLHSKLSTSHAGYGYWHILNKTVPIAYFSVLHLMLVFFTVLYPYSICKWLPIMHIVGITPLGW